MNFRTATLLVLGMFGSFAIVIGAMVLLFWSPSSKRAEGRQDSIERRAPGPERPESDTTSLTDPAPGVEISARSDISTKEEESLQRPPAATPEPSENPPARRRVKSPGRVTQRNLKLEQEEMKLLRVEMQRRLEARVQARLQKLAQLAKQCGNLEAGEVVQILVVLDDSDLGEVMKRMERAKAIQVAALLTRLGRGNAISLK